MLRRNISSYNSIDFVNVNDLAVVICYIVFVLNGMPGVAT